MLDDAIRVEHYVAGHPRRVNYTRGTGVLTPPGHTRLMRIRSPGQEFAELQLSVPQLTLDVVADQIRGPRVRGSRSLRDDIFLRDPAIHHFAVSVASALARGASESYAQIAAEWLAAHLLLGGAGDARRHAWQQRLTKEGIADYRLVRVLEYIRAHLSDQLDLRTLAREAGISPFHFATLFRKAVGSTPHRHVLRLRMDAAQGMLRETDKSIIDIAMSCGFGNASHFAASFRRHFSQSPTQYRTTIAPSRPASARARS